MCCLVHMVLRMCGYKEACAGCLIRLVSARASERTSERVCACTKIYKWLVVYTVHCSLGARAISLSPITKSIYTCFLFDRHLVVQVLPLLLLFLLLLSLLPLLLL